MEEHVSTIIVNQSTGWAAFVTNNHVRIERGESRLSVPLTDIDFLISLLEDAQIRSQRHMQVVR